MARTGPKSPLGHKPKSSPPRAPGAAITLDELFADKGRARSKGERIARILDPHSSRGRRATLTMGDIANPMRSVGGRQGQRDEAIMRPYRESAQRAAARFDAVVAWAKEHVPDYNSRTLADVAALYDAAIRDRK